MMGFVKRMTFIKTLASIVFRELLRVKGTKGSLFFQTYESLKDPSAWVKTSFNKNNNRKVSSPILGYLGLHQYF
jgi:hypothetical protein